MSVNLLTELSNKVGSSLVSHSADFLGEKEAETSTAVSGTFATMMASLIQKGSTDKGASDLFKMVKKSNPNILTNVDNIFTRSPQTVNGLMNVGTRDIPVFLGNKHREATNLVAAESGIKKDSSSKLMKISAPFVMSVLGKHVEEKNLDKAGLMNLINAQKENVKSAMPGNMVDELELSAFGWEKKPEPVVEKKVKKKKVKAEKVVKEETEVKEKVVKKKKKEKAVPVTQEVSSTASDAAGAGMGWLKWLFPLLLIIGVLWFLGTRGCSGGNPVTDAASKVASTTTNVVKDAGAATKNAATAVTKTVGNALGAVNDGALKALDGIKFAAGSAGSQMMNFIKGGAKGDGKFRFKNLTFASGSANIGGGSGVEVDNLASILKAYTDVKVSVDGYTDSKGNADKNMTLSQQRADAVKARLVSQGIDASRISTKGYGAADPVATNDTAEGRAQNRRIEVTILK